MLFKLGKVSWSLEYYKHNADYLIETSMYTLKL
jgi:hypothetical protein